MSNEIARDNKKGLPQRYDYHNDKAIVVYANALLRDATRLENEAERINKTPDSTDPNAEEHGTSIGIVERNARGNMQPLPVPELEAIRQNTIREQK
jgi:hypothetical protein